MESVQSSVDKIYECWDLCGEIVQAYYLMESVKDAIGVRWEEEQLIQHIAYLLSEYDDKMEKLLPALNKGLDEAFHLARNEALKTKNNRPDEVYQTNTVG